MPETRSDQTESRRESSRFRRGTEVSPRERAWVLRTLGLFMFVVGSLFVTLTLMGFNLGQGFLTALVVLCGGGLFLIVGANMKWLQDIVHDFLEKGVGR